MSRKLTIFLCHASEDKLRVRELYEHLRQDGFDPWFDDANLRPGDDWKYEIQKAVPAADIVIVCLSCRAIGKRGFVQTEIRLALEVAKQQPEGTVFLIPARLEHCELPQSLRIWQAVDLFDSTGYSKLKDSLVARAIARQLWNETPDDSWAPQTDSRTLQSILNEIKDSTGAVAPGLKTTSDMLSASVNRVRIEPSLQNLSDLCRTIRLAWAEFSMTWTDECPATLRHQLTGAFQEAIDALGLVTDSAVSDKQSEVTNKYAESISLRAGFLERNLGVVTPTQQQLQDLAARLDLSYAEIREYAVPSSVPHDARQLVRDAIQATIALTDSQDRRGALKRLAKLCVFFQTLMVWNVAPDDAAIRLLVDHLCAIHSQMENLVLGQDFSVDLASHFWRLEGEFHSTLCHISGFKDLVHVVDDVVENFQNVGMPRSKVEVADTLSEHAAIISAIRQREGQGIFKVLSDHVMKASQRWSANAIDPHPES